MNACYPRAAWNPHVGGRIPSDNNPSKLLFASTSTGKLTESRVRTGLLATIAKPGKIAYNVQSFEHHFLDVKSGFSLYQSTWFGRSQTLPPLNGPATLRVPIHTPDKSLTLRPASCVEYLRPHRDPSECMWTSSFDCVHFDYQYLCLKQSSAG